MQTFCRTEESILIINTGVNLLFVSIQLAIVDPQERGTRRSGVRSAMPPASQLSGRGPTDVGDAPAPAF